MDKSTLYFWLSKPPPGFPLPIMLGKQRNGKPLHRWRKWDVYAWLDRTQAEEEKS